MSIVCVKVDKGDIKIACDSQVTYNGTYKLDIQKHYGLGKLIDKNGVVIGSVGNLSEIARMELFLRTTKPESSDMSDIMEFFSKFHAYCKTFDTNFIPFNEWIIVYDGKAAKIDESMSVYDITNYCAIGSGMLQAVPLLEMGMGVKEAVAMACKLDLYCREPIIEKLIKTNE